MTICSIIKGPSLSQAKEQIENSFAFANLFEFRLDLFASLEEGLSLSQEINRPKIFTLRTGVQNGKFFGNEKEYMDKVRSFCQFHPEYIDIEHHISPSFIEEIFTFFPHIKIIISYHNFEKTPDNLFEIFTSMHRTGASLYKVCCMAHSTIDALRLLHFARKVRGCLPVSMGPYGQISRILGPIVASPFVYAASEEGQEQLSCKELFSVYRTHLASSKTQIFGLIGSPVDQSIGHLVHNKWFAERKMDALYVKMDVDQENLLTFFQYAKALAFSGLSVTMPLKECVFPYLDVLDEDALAIGALNTICFREGLYGCIPNLCGYNTDGVGGLDVIERNFSVKEKSIVILGAGGSAKALAYEARKRGAFVTVLSRDVAKAKKVAENLQCSFGSFDEDYPPCNVLINCTPNEIPANKIPKDAYYMDIRVTGTQEGRGSSTLSWYPMFMAQAKEQLRLFSKRG